MHGVLVLVEGPARHRGESEARYRAGCDFWSSTLGDSVDAAFAGAVDAGEFEELSVRHAGLFADHCFFQGEEAGAIARCAFQYHVRERDGVRGDDGFAALLVGRLLPLFDKIWLLEFLQRGAARHYCVDGGKAGYLGEGFFAVVGGQVHLALVEAVHRHRVPVRVFGDVLEAVDGAVQAGETNGQVNFQGGLEDGEERLLEEMGFAFRILERLEKEADTGR